MSNHWEDNIYQKGLHLNRYPFGELISVFYNALAYLETGDEKKSVLELGCGAGNNLWFFAENGFNTVGIDGSSSACKIAESLLEKRQLAASVRCMNFDDITEELGQFDIIIDRAATYCAPFETRQIWWQNILKCLKPGGVVISFNFDKSSIWYQKSVNEPGFATRVAEDTYSGFAYGALKDTGVSHFVDQYSLENLFSPLQTIQILHHQCNPVGEVNLDYAYSELIYVGRKTKA